ncbi:HET-domain-containing protein [Staphylotrichum tortipilum]|uniref:HET-domain-containing protein n=1 Tax=Staphylotrichum tortipilum TaxID=2831512 RepID=A0AAN6RWF5_9PEZI|nr:HET-domain-containing protein [Staphylotrichum longicolle]
MRLINVRTRELEEHVIPPPYAILSHTWRDTEISFRDMTTCADVWSRPACDKIYGSVRKAVRHHLDYVWIDTCCIDKSSSAELSEAINSMFRWYKDAAVCFAYLEDLPVGQGDATEAELGRCRWFTRGWTLQELIAPDEIQFYDRGWNDRGTKEALQDALSHITGIGKDVLLGRNLSRLGSIPVAERMSWASRRRTTRQEDMAYCLLGIFDVNMPMIYGEGTKAFIRLQEEIIKRTNDLSILAWDSRGRSRAGRYCGVLSESPAEFAHVPRGLSTSTRSFTTEFAVTNSGLRITTELWVSSNPTAFNRSHLGYFLCLSDDRKPPFVGIHLKKFDRDHFVRISDKPLTVDYLNSNNIDWTESARLQTIYIATSYFPQAALDIMVEWPPIHFPAHPAFTLTAVAPRASWDVFDRIFHTGVRGISGFVGVVCVDVLGIGGTPRGAAKLGVVVRAMGKECSLFKWEGLAQQQMESVFEKAPELVSQEALSRALDPVLRGPCVEYRFGSDHFRVSASIEKEVINEISPGPLYSVHIRGFRKSAGRKDWVSLG